MKETPLITEGDDEANAEGNIFELFGLDYNDNLNESLENYRDILTKEIINNRLDEVLKILKLDTPDLDIDFYVARYLQILGVFILRTGAYLPDDLRQKIAKAANPEYDGYKFHNKEFQEDRNEILEDFRQKILNYKSGQIIRI